jgi:hypothetical protein
MSARWERFCEAVQHESLSGPVLDRHHHSGVRNANGVLVSSVLEELGRAVERLELLRVLPAGSRLWRARAHESPSIAGSAKELGTVPREIALQANRLSPAGIAMFYGSEDAETAVRETAVRSSARWVTSGQFETSQSCVVVDFASFSAVVSSSLVGQVRRGADGRHPLVFLQSLISQLRRPARERYEHIDYVPTQVVTEYLLHSYSQRRPIRGMLYSSTLTGRPSAVLDIPNDRCVEYEPGWADASELHLGLVPGSVHTEPLGDTRTD